METETEMQPQEMSFDEMVARAKDHLQGLKIQKNEIGDFLREVQKDGEVLTVRFHSEGKYYEVDTFSPLNMVNVKKAVMCADNDSNVESVIALSQRQEEPQVHVFLENDTFYVFFEEPITYKDLFPGSAMIL